MFNESWNIRIEEELTAQKGNKPDFYKLVRNASRDVLQSRKREDAEKCVQSAVICGKNAQLSQTPHDFTYM